MIALDVDPSATERHYLALRGQKAKGILPLNVDLTNPAGGLGWAHRERMPLLKRINADLVLALG